FSQSQSPYGGKAAWRSRAKKPPPVAPALKEQSVTARSMNTGAGSSAQEPHRDIPEATVARLPVYLRALTSLADRNIASCSSEELAAAAGVNSAKLRKDLFYLGSYGIRGVGYDVDYLS